MSPLSPLCKLEDDDGSDEVGPLPGRSSTFRRLSHLRNFSGAGGGLAAAGIGGSAAQRSAVEPAHVLLLVDCSGSMRIEDVRMRESHLRSATTEIVSRLAAATTCAAKFVRSHCQRHPNDLFSCVTFGTSTRVACKWAGCDEMQA